MANINYMRGYRLEYGTKKALEGNGWMVTRLPASKSPADLIAFNDKHKLLVQCKKTQKDSMYIYGLGELLDLSRHHNAIPLLVYAFNRTEPYAKVVDSGKQILKRCDDNVPLAEYLKVI